MFCTGLCFNIKTFSLVSLPWHVLSLVRSLYPFLQLHSKLPTVFLHTWSHPALFMRHSSMSVPREREREREFEQIHMHWISAVPFSSPWFKPAAEDTCEIIKKEQGVTDCIYDRFVWLKLSAYCLNQKKRGRKKRKKEKKRFFFHTETLQKWKQFGEH